MADAKLNVKDVLLTFRGDYLKSLGGKFLMFLDVESTPPLALSYYKGWASTLSDYSQTLTRGDVTLLPCVYGVQSDNATWRAIASAADQGVTCHGVWIARWKWRGCHPVPPWNAAAVTPSVTLPCDVLVWQYSDECHGGDGYDCNTTNPGIDFDAFIKQLILPPETRLLGQPGCESSSLPPRSLWRRVSPGRRSSIVAPCSTSIERCMWSFQPVSPKKHTAFGPRRGSICRPR